MTFSLIFRYEWGAQGSCLGLLLFKYMIFLQLLPSSLWHAFGEHDTGHAQVDMLHRSRLIFS